MNRRGKRGQPTENRRDEWNISAVPTGLERMPASLPGDQSPGYSQMPLTGQIRGKRFAACPFLFSRMRVPLFNSGLLSRRFQFQIFQKISVPGADVTDHTGLLAALGEV